MDGFTLLSRQHQDHPEPREGHRMEPGGVWNFPHLPSVSCCTIQVDITQVERDHAISSVPAANGLCIMTS